MKPVHIITPFFCQKGFNEFSVKYFEFTISTICTAGYPFEWTIIDNNSSEDIVEWLKTKVESLDYVKRIIYNDKNYGIGKAMNQGIDLGPKDYILKLDADMSFYKNNWLKELVWAADNIQSAGAFGVSVEKNTYSTFKYEEREFQNHIAHIGGACFLVPKRIFDLIGYWSEEYDPYGGTDGDYGMRIRYAGYKNLYLKDKEIAKHCFADTSESNSQAYRQFKSKSRNDNSALLNANLAAYEKKQKLKLVRDSAGNLVSA